MGFHLTRLSCLFILFCVLKAHAEAPPFPAIGDIEIEFYQTEVTVTNLDQQITALATEYYDNTVQRGKVDVLADGNRLTVYYNNDTNQILELNSTTCQAWDIDESQYDYEPIFYGWLNKEPLVIGPSAPIWYAQPRRDQIVSLGESVIRDIKCQQYSLRIEEKRTNVTIFYHFADESWTTPYQMGKLRVPIRIEVSGVTSRYSQNPDNWMPLNQVTDFAYFKPSISDWLAFQPPVGIGCPLRKTTRTIPPFPKVFMYAAEVYDLLKAGRQEKADVEFQRVWYDSTRLVARLDKFTRKKYTKELYDFNMGVTYRNLNERTCTIHPLENSFFEGYDGKMIGHLKEPNEVLDLDGSFYYMGDRLIRGIWCQSFESIKQDVVFQGQTLKKLVITVYYVQDNYEVAVSGETESRIPIFYVVTGWDTATHISIKLQYNIFGFNDVIWPEMYESFQLEQCYPSMNDKSYFIMIMNVDGDYAAKLEDMDDMFKIALRSKINSVAKISDMRLPMLQVDYKPSGVFITGLILERPPAIMQFIQGLEVDTTTTDPDIKPIIEADNKETCAYACVDEEDFICTGFYMCNDACFLKSKDMLDTDDGDKIQHLGKCTTWLRAERDSSNAESYLPQALQLLEQTVVDGQFKIKIRVNESETDVIPISDIVIGDGPYTGDDNQETPYTEVVKFAKLKTDASTTEVVADVSTINQCYKSCKDSELTQCASFSYCPAAANKQCLVSSVLVTSRENNVKDTEEDQNCFVYSMKYMDFYIAYPGRYFLITGQDAYYDIKAVEECAKLCREEKKFECRGFEYCRNTKTCVLHSKHVTDLKHENSTHNPLIKPSVCTHYAAKFAADYYDMGASLLVDKDSDDRTDITLEECAKVCSEELKDNCRSFNYCPPTDAYSADSSCSLSKEVMLKGGKKTTKDKCRHFEKKSFVDDWGTRKKTVKEEHFKDDSGYTSKGFTGLVIGMLALGLILGAIGFVGYSYFRSRASGEGLTVRFMKSDI